MDLHEIATDKRRSVQQRRRSGRGLHPAVQVWKRELPCSHALRWRLYRELLISSRSLVLIFD
jgi:hypothetical protein